VEEACAQLFCRATHEGDRHSHGIGCTGVPGDPIGDLADCCYRYTRGGCGLAGGFVLGHCVTSLLFEVKPGHAATVVFPLLGLMLVCLFAALPPTLRASRLNPVVALRQE
jgi:hypothetical protein